MGVSAYLPPALGRTHPAWNTPYVALIVQGILSSILILISLYGANVAEAYEKLLSSSVAIQLVPFLYLFAGLWKLKTKRIWAALGFGATALGVLLVFIPSSDVTHPIRFVVEVSASFLVMIGVALLLYHIQMKKRRRPVTAG